MMNDMPLAVIRHMNEFLYIKDKARFIQTQKGLYKELYPECMDRVRKAIGRIERCYASIMTPAVFKIYLSLGCMTRRTFARWMFRRLWHGLHREDALQYMIFSSSSGVFDHSDMTDRALTACIDQSVITLDLLYHIFEGCPDITMLWVIHSATFRFLQRSP